MSKILHTPSKVKVIFRGEEVVVEDLAIHPLALLFPEMPSDEFEKLERDITARGQIEPIVFSNDHKTLLDGRHRLKCCLRIGITPRGTVFEAMHHTSEADFIWSRNVLRRHLTDDQRAAIGHEWADAEKEAAKQRQRIHGGTAPGKPKITSGESAHSVRTRAAVAKKIGVTELKVRQVESIAAKAPELLPKVASGEMSLKDADSAARNSLAPHRRVASALPGIEASPDGSLSPFTPMLVDADKAETEDPQREHVYLVVGTRRRAGTLAVDLMDRLKELHISLFDADMHPVELKADRQHFVKIHICRTAHTNGR